MLQSPAPADEGRESGLVRTAKAARTRRRLLEAARTVFERDGFLNARVVDIAKEAGLSHGSFYTYFDSKQQIFRAVIADFNEGIYRHDSDDRWTSLTPIQRVELANRRFYDTYLANLQMFRLYEEAASYDDDVRQHRITDRHYSEGRIRRAIERFQAAGKTPPDLNPEIAASSLVAMATHSFYSWHIREERGYDVEEANRTLTYLWAAALGLQPEPRDDEFYQSLRRSQGTTSPVKGTKKTATKASKRTVGKDRARPRPSKA